MSADIRELIRFAREFSTERFVIAKQQPLMLRPWWEAGLRRSVREAHKNLQVKHKEKTQ